MPVVEDSGRGYRRVVPSPIPEHIVESDVIRQLVQNGTVVIAAGGGGVPVILQGNNYIGIEAVIDKDFASELLAYELGAELFIILTDVEHVAINYRTPAQQDLTHLSLSEARKYSNQGQFAKGSMGPKVEAAIRFIQHGGKKAIITHPFSIEEALAGRTGTVIA